MQVLPTLTRDQIRDLLRQMSDAGVVHSRGVTSNAGWYLGPEALAPKDRRSQDDPK